jgi:SAM-dependent methyltransferase
MHSSLLEHMERLVNKHLSTDDLPLILDIGSYGVNGCYKPIFNYSNWQYRGLDLSPGSNVDIILDSPYEFPQNSNSVDVIISRQTFEHIEYFWLTFQEMARVLKPSGLIFLIAPSRGHVHSYPQDCWRFYPDGYKALAKYCSLELLEVNTDWKPHSAQDSAVWGDTVGVFVKKQPCAGKNQERLNFMEITRG